MNTVIQGLLQWQKWKYCSVCATFSSCITLSSMWFSLDFDVLVLMNSLQWYLSKSITGNEVLLQFLREIILQWIDLRVRTLVYLAWFSSSPSQFHTFSSSHALQNGWFSLHWLFFFLLSFALSWLSYGFSFVAEELNICVLDNLEIVSCHSNPYFCLRLVCQLLLVFSTLVTSVTYSLFLWNFIITIPGIKPSTSL